MQTNLHVYHRTLEWLSQLLPDKRITQLRNMALLIAGLYLGESVHLPHIVRKWPSRSTESSLANRLHRFLDNRRIDVRRWYEPEAKQLLARFDGVPIRLVMDTTKVSSHRRLLTIGVAYKRRVLPLAWSVHRGSRGHTPVRAQIELLSYVRGLLPAGSEVWVVGDCEFGSVQVVTWLRSQGWHFVMRQKGVIKVAQADGDWTKIEEIPLQRGQTLCVGWVRLTQKHDCGWFWLILHWDSHEVEPWYLISDVQGEHRLLRRYRIRMWIEEMFGDMKGHGFNLEATHLDDPERLSRLFLGVAFTFVWLIAVGGWVVKSSLRRLVDRKKRRDKSYFRIGRDWMERCLRVGDPIPILPQLVL